jgi:thiol-disulfide isomerase/thioredoxin
MKSQKIYVSLLLLLLLNLVPGLIYSQDPQVLEIGDAAPGFSLPGVDGKTYNLESFDDYKVLVFIFTANHCPTAQAYEDKIIDLYDKFHAQGVGFVLISPNDPKAVALEEMGYSDLGDTFQGNKIRAANKKFPMPFLYDGETQEMSHAYGPRTTPHVFIFDDERKLRFSGRIDEMENPYVEAYENNTHDAIAALLEGKPVPVETTRTFGCSVKWSEKRKGVSRLDSLWKLKTVELVEIDLEGVSGLLANETGNYKLINVWATWCGPCIIEFPEFVAMQRMYSKRNFEFVSISLDGLNQKEKVHSFLDENDVSGTHYIYNEDNKYSLMDAIDKNWSGAIPYTILLAPDGEVIYSNEGLIDPVNVRFRIIEKMGRFYADNPERVVKRRE